MWVVDETPLRRVLLDSLLTVAAPTTLEGILTAERRHRHRVPPALRDRFSGKIPTPVGTGEEQVIDFGNALRAELDAIEPVADDSDAAIVHRGQAEMSGGASTYWLVRAHWATQTGHPKLAQRALLQVERWATCRAFDTRRWNTRSWTTRKGDCSPAQAVRFGFQRMFLREATAAIRQRKSWQVVRDHAMHAYAINPQGPHAQESSVLLDRIERLEAAVRYQPDRLDQAQTPLQRIDTLIGLLPEQAEYSFRHGHFYNGHLAKSPVRELAAMGRAAVPVLLTHLADDTPTRSGETVGNLILEMLEYLSDSPGHGNALADRRARVREWWVAGGAGLRDSVLKPPPRQAANLPPEWGQNLDKPPYAALTFAPKNLAKRAESRRTGSLFVAAKGPQWLPREHSPLDLDGDAEPIIYPVLDPGEGRSTARRVQLLCEQPAHRISLWRGARDLRRTNRVDTVLLPRRSQKPNTTVTPGLRVPAGTHFKLGRATDTHTMTTYSDEQLWARGWIDSDTLDVVWTLSVAQIVDAQKPTDGVLKGTVVRLRDQPGGHLFARIHNDYETEIRIVETREGSVLVEARLNEVVVVGWVDAKNVSPAKASTSSLIGKGGGGARLVKDVPWVTVRRGSLLVHEPSEQVVGVVTWDTTFTCDGACSLPARVWVDACEGQLAVRVIPPPS